MLERGWTLLRHYSTVPKLVLDLYQLVKARIRRWKAKVPFEADFLQSLNAVCRLKNNDPPIIQEITILTNGSIEGRTRHLDSMLQSCSLQVEPELWGINPINLRSHVEVFFKALEIF